MKREEVREKLSQTVGVTKAESILSEAEAALGYTERDSYTDLEIRSLCEQIKQRHDGYVWEVANHLHVRTQAKERFQTLLENVPNPTVIVEFEDREPVIRSVNEAFERVFGYDSDTAVGDSLVDLLVPEDDQLPFDVWSRADGETEREVRRLTADGEERTVLVRRAIATRGNGQVEGYALYTDISQRKRREEKLKRQNERLDEFASVVSHDLRNPLGIAQTYLDFAEETGDPDDFETARAALERMDTMIDELLALAQTETTIDASDRVELATVVTDAWHTARTEVATLDLVIDESVTVDGDPELLQNVFENLFRNAVDHNDPPLTVRVGADEGMIYVEDDGVGIPEADRENVFDHGFTTNDDTTGLGLSIVSTIVEAHGWKVSVTDSADGGARFEISGVNIDL